MRGPGLSPVVLSLGRCEYERFWKDEWVDSDFDAGVFK